MGTTNRIKVKGLPMLSAETIHEKFTSNKTTLEGMTIIKEKKAEIRKKKIVVVDKNPEKKDDEDEDAEILEQERQEKIEKLKSLKRRGEKLTAEEKKSRKEM